MNVLMKLPDCEVPRLTAWLTAFATGFGVPTLSVRAYRKNDTMSRVAARPRPRTSGSRAVYASSYARAGSKPPLRQMLAGSGAPGNGVSRQLANLQSLGAMVTTRPLIPVTV